MRQGEIWVYVRFPVFAVPLHNWIPPSLIMCWFVSSSFIPFLILLPMLSETLETSTPQIHPGPSPFFSILQGESFPWCGLSGIWWVLLSCFFF